MTFKPTAEQDAITTAVTSTTANLAIKARAGAAKSTTLLLICEALPRTTSILILAFNKKIADEIRPKLPPNADAKTLNSLGGRAWAGFLGRYPKLDDGKCRQDLRELIKALPQKEQEEAWDSFSDLMKAVAEAKTQGYLPEGTHPHARPLIGDQSFYDLLEIETPAFFRELIDEVLRLSFKKALKGVVDFNDQIYCPAIMSVSFDPVDVVLVDEAQDLSPINHVILRKLVGKRRLIAVGDPCQPDGTLITRVLHPADRWNEAKLEQVPIEDIRVGDTVLGYNGLGAFLYNRRVEDITRKPYEGELIAVTGSGINSKYTPNHHCYASFSSLREQHALYLMQKGNGFRMGICKMDYGDLGSGPIVRARHEDADAVWILDTYADPKTARLMEAFYQAKHGIPDLTFSEPSGNLDRGFLESFWGMAESLDLEYRANDCLREFGRDILYPLWERGQPYTSLKRPIVVRACNLITGCKMLPYTGKSKISAQEWQSIDVGREHYSGFVTSFTISDNHLYVADNLVTHNCQAIYGFRGASENSMDLLIQLFQMKEFFLTICFRSAEAIVRNARWRAPDMQWRDGAPPGLVAALDKWGPSDLRDGDAIICRNNAPIFGMALALLRAGLYPEILGTESMAYISGIMKKLGKPSISIAEAELALSEWGEKARKKYKSSKKVEDIEATIRFFFAEASTLADALDAFQRVLNASGRIKLMTGHRSKGLEFDRVFFLDQFLLKKGEGQEDNVRYVIATRARLELYYVESRGWSA